MQLIVQRRKKLQCLEEQWKWAGSQLCRSAGTVPNQLISELNQRWRRIGASAHIACDRKYKRSLDSDSLKASFPSFRRCPAAGSIEVGSRVRIALAKNAGCLQNGSHMLLLTWTDLVSCLFCKKGQEERVACVIRFVRSQHF